MAQRLLTASVLAVWMLPGLGAAALALHVFLDHHSVPGHAGHRNGHEHEHEEGSRRELGDLARVVSHGHHHHGAVTPEHEHEAVLEGDPKALGTATLKIALGEDPTARRVLSSDREPAFRPWRLLPVRCGPPSCLFTKHCSLLL